MKKIILVFFTVLLNTITVHVSAQSEADMKAWQEFMTPGEMHKWMAKQVGTWEAEVSSWMGPGDPVKSKATDVVTMSMNGLYQVGNFSSIMMGMPFQGQSTLGYDNGKKQFVLTWIDNFGSGIIMMQGNYDEKTRTLTLNGKQTDPVTGKDANIRQVNVYHNEDSYTATMYGNGPDGNEMKFMEATYKRKK
jgi:hypothetical protein